MTKKRIIDKLPKDSCCYSTCIKSSSNNFYEIDSDIPIEFQLELENKELDKEKEYLKYLEEADSLNN